MEKEIIDSRISDLCFHSSRHYLTLHCHCYIFVMDTYLGAQIWQVLICNGQDLLIILLMKFSQAIYWKEVLRGEELIC